MSEAADLTGAWHKWSRAVEQQRVLAKDTRQFPYETAFDYVQISNAGDSSDPLLRAQWRLKINEPYPTRWGVLIGDVLTNLRAALDHAMWTAVLRTTGEPTRPRDVVFPIALTGSEFRNYRSKLKPLVPEAVWQYIDDRQPSHAGVNDPPAYTSPLAILNWLVNRDKHRHLLSLRHWTINLDEEAMWVEPPLDIVERWQPEGPVADGSVVGRLKARRPLRDGGELSLRCSFAHEMALQINDYPIDYRPLASVMEIMTEHVLAVLCSFTHYLGLSYPDADLMELGDEHELFSPERGGNRLFFHQEDGTTRLVSLDGPEVT